jgi:MFS family permease
MATSTGTGQTARTAGAPQAFVLILAMMMPIASLMAMVPNLPQFYQHFADLPSKDLLVPMILTIPALCNALLSPFVGALADRIGRRKLLLSALFVHFAFGASAYFLHSIYAILATRVAVGVAEATILTLANVLLGDYYEQEERQKWLAYQSILGSIIATSLVLLGGYLGTLSWNSPFLIHLLSLVMFAVSFVFIFEPRQSETQPAQGEVGPAAGFPVLAMTIVGGVSLFCSSIYFVQTIQLGRIFETFGVESSGYIGVAMTLASIGVILGGILYRRLSRKTVAQLLATVFLFYAIGLTSLGLADTLILAVPLAIIAQVGNGMMIPILVSWALSTLSFAHRGRGMGLWNSAFYVGSFLSPVLVAFVTSMAGLLMAAIFWIGLACFVFSAATLIGLRGIVLPVAEAAD